RTVADAYTENYSRRGRFVGLLRRVARRGRRKRAWMGQRLPLFGRLATLQESQDTSGARPSQAGRLAFVPPPSSTEGRPVIEALKQKLTDEAEKLRFELNVTLPNEIRKAVELGDLRENSEYKAAL